jgi:acyl carrier protein
MAASTGDRNAQRRSSSGFESLSPSEGAGALGLALASDLAQIAVLPFNWAVVGEVVAAAPRPSLLSDLLPPAPARKPAAPVVRLGERLGALPAAERMAALVAYVQSVVGGVLGLDPSEPPDPRQGLFEMGLDSLMALDVKNTLQEATERALPSTLLFNYGTVDALAGYLANEVLGLAPTQAAPPAPSDEERLRDVLSVEELTEAEMDAFITRELTSLSQDTNGRSS